MQCREDPTGAKHEEVKGEAPCRPQAGLGGRSLLFCSFVCLTVSLSFYNCFILDRGVSALRASQSQGRVRSGACRGGIRELVGGRPIKERRWRRHCSQVRTGARRTQLVVSRGMARIR
jgi:hypothetical protein